jgi:hypothetical protein
LKAKYYLVREKLHREFLPVIPVHGSNESKKSNSQLKEKGTRRWGDKEMGGQGDGGEIEQKLEPLFPMIALRKWGDKKTTLLVSLSPHPKSPLLVNL